MSLISVVMSIYNGAAVIQSTLDSILSQDGVDLELIVINDGSTDQTLEILEDYKARDNRIIIINQENKGLTLSLIRGCIEAKGKYIARHDADDISLKGRLKKQLAVFENEPDVKLVSCGTNFVGPGGELLYTVLQKDRSADENLRATNPKILRGPSHHGCTMFPRESYMKVGGYRSQFMVAQDLDLWTRLVEQGKHMVVPDVLYQANLQPGAISCTKRKQQVLMTSLICEAVKKRRMGKSDEPILEKAQKINFRPAKENKRIQDSRFFYFIACCLAGRDKEKARYYYKRAIRNNPLNLKAIFRLTTTL